MSQHHHEHCDCTHHDHHHDDHSCCCDHHKHHSHKHQTHSILTIRSYSGLSGDMILCGLLKMLDLPQEKLDELLTHIYPAFKGILKIEKKEIQHISGWHAKIELPHEHEHRTLKDILEIIRSSAMSPEGAWRAEQTFTLLAQAEGAVHGIPFTEVHFHEVGALDSILDICLACELLAILNPDHLIVSALPIADGSIVCAHGVIPSPAPAVQMLLEGVSVRPIETEGETITPTAIALLKANNAQFSHWPAMTIEKTALIYGDKVFEGIPNGALFAYGHH